jgi:hypothetical protein
MKMFVLSRTLFLNSTGPSAPLEISRDGSRRLVVGSRWLPENVWIRILRCVADPEDLLSKRQCESIIAWAEDLTTLQKEREVVGKLRSLQLWRVLDGLGCLAYE